jgi:CRISPR-associated endonuclease Csn1
MLSPHDLVYVPTEDELANISEIDFSNLTKEQKKRVYKFVSCTEKEAHFVPYSNASEIIKNENGTNSKSERLQDFNDHNCRFDLNSKPIMIKTNCIKLKVDRLGNISKA